LDSTYQTYPQSYWEKQVISPSGFIMYLWVDGELPQFKHHTLVFNDDWKTGFDQIFKTPQWPNDPSYYICNPSKTDPSVAPVWKENLFVLVPIAPWLASTPESLQQYADKILDDIAISCDVPDLKKRVEVCELFSVPQFEQYYNAYKWTALWLAHTMFQSAIWRPNNYSKKAKWLYYSWWYTTPWIGMPMCLISAMLVAERIFKKNS
jgi:phytoene desaturase